MKGALCLSCALQVSRFRSFVKPVADRFQQRARFIGLSLRPPELRKVCGGPQFQRPGVLLARHVDRLLEMRLGFRDLRRVEG